MTCCTEQHRDMSIMAARVHGPWVAGSVRQAGLLGDRKGIHIGTEADRRPLTSGQRANDAGAPEARPDPKPAGGELAGDEVSRPRFREGELGMGVKVAPPSDHSRNEVAVDIHDALRQPT